MVASGERPGERIVREFGMDMYTLLYVKWIINKDLLVAQGTLLNDMWKPEWEGLGGRMDTYIYVWLSPFAVHLKLSQHCSLDILQYKIKS